MAYMSQDRKKELAPKIKAILKKYGVKGSIGVSNHSTLRVKIKEGYLDLIGNFIEGVKREERHYPDSRGNIEYVERKQYLDVNHYHYDKYFTGKPLAFITELIDAMNEGNWDKSDSQTDYFNVGWYIDINIGDYDKPYKFIKLTKVTK